MLTLSECNSPAAKSSPPRCLSSLKFIKHTANLSGIEGSHCSLWLLPFPVLQLLRYDTWPSGFQAAPQTWRTLSCAEEASLPQWSMWVFPLSPSLLHIKGCLLVASISNTSSYKESKILDVTMSVCTYSEYDILVTKPFVWPTKCHNSRFIACSCACSGYTLHTLT